MLETLLGTAPVGVAFFDRELRYLRVNSALAAMNGLPVEAHIGRSLSEVVPDLAPALEPLLRRVIATGEPILDHDLSGETAAAPGEQRRWLESYHPFREEDGSIRGVAVVVRDVTEQWRAERERERAEQRQRLLIEAGRLLAASLDYQVTLQNVACLSLPTLADMVTVDLRSEQGGLRRVAAAHRDRERQSELAEFGRRFPVHGNPRHPAQRVLRSGRSLLAPVVSDELLTAASLGPEQRAALERFEIRSAMIVPLVARGRTFGVISLSRTSASPPYDAEDLALAEALAERAALAVDNARLYAEAREAVQLRDEFLSIAAHELRTPLTTIRTQVQLGLRRLAREGTLEPAQTARSLRAIEKQSGRLERLIAQLLDVSRIQSGRLELELQEIDLAELVGAILADARGRIAERQIVGRLPERLPARVDPMRLEQVLINLLDNADKYSPPSLPIEVELRAVAGQPPAQGRTSARAAVDAQEAEIAVRDYGPGIPPEKRDQVFERYFQAHTQTRSGMGLGLYISRQIMDLHGGRLEVECPEDGGSRFLVRLPLRSGAGTSNRASASGTRGASDGG